MAALAEPLDCRMGGPFLNYAPRIFTMPISTFSIP